MIQLENISKSYPDGTLFSNVNISLQRGVRAGLVGQNGSGKTTLLKMMLGKESTDSGNIKKVLRSADNVLFLRYSFLVSCRRDGGIVSLHVDRNRGPVLPSFGSEVYAAPLQDGKPPAHASRGRDGDPLTSA